MRVGLRQLSVFRKDVTPYRGQYVAFLQWGDRGSFLT